MRELLHVFLVDHDDHHQIGATVTDDDRVGDVGRHFEFVFQFAGRDVFATCRDDDVFHPVGDAEKPFIVHDAHIPRVQPTFGIDRLGGLLGLVQVAFEHVGATHQDLAGLRVQTNVVERGRWTNRADFDAIGPDAC